MMTHAYDEMYLSKVAKSMGNMLHYAVYDFDYDGDDFLKQFIQSGIANQIEKGNPKFTSGKSGFELFCDVIDITENTKITEKPSADYVKSDVYWVGWALAHYQWFSQKSFSVILHTVSFNKLLCLYPTLHESDIKKFYEVVDLHFNKNGARLKLVREDFGLTQNELAKASGVSLNTIRAYERKAKDINKAQIGILQKLATALNCRVEDLLD